MNSDKCDGCSFCCTVLGVVELQKPPGTACKFCTGISCTIHEDRSLYPPTCRDFECGFLIHNLPREFRPDHCKIMITGEDAELRAHILHVDPAHPYAPHTILGQQLLSVLLKHGRYPNLLVVTGDKENIYSKDPVSRRILRDKLERLKAEESSRG